MNWRCVISQVQAKNMLLKADWAEDAHACKGQIKDTLNKDELKMYWLRLSKKCIDRDWVEDFLVEARPKMLRQSHGVLVKAKPKITWPKSG